MIRRLRARISKAIDKPATVRSLIKASLPLWVSVVLGCGVGLVAVSHLAGLREHDQVCQRVDGREQLRGVFLSLYDRLDETFPSTPVVIDLRHDLDALYPALEPC